MRLLHAQKHSIDFDQMATGAFTKRKRGRGLQESVADLGLSWGFHPGALKV